MSWKQRYYQLYEKYENLLNRRPLCSYFYDDDTISTSYLTTIETAWLSRMMKHYIKVITFEELKWDFSDRSYLITITFDRRRFIRTLDIYTQNYFEFVFCNMCKNFNLVFVAVLERHKDGWYHAHMIADINMHFIADIEVYLKRYFSDNMKNSHCIDIKRANSKALNYIAKTDTPDKRGDVFYTSRYYQDHSLLLDN